MDTEHFSSVPVHSDMEQEDLINLYGEQTCRKDLRKYLGVTNENLVLVGHSKGSFKKDLGKFLGIEENIIEKMMINKGSEEGKNKYVGDSRLRFQLKVPYQETINDAGSEGYSSIDLSSSSIGSCTTSSDDYSISNRLLK